MKLPLRLAAKATCRLAILLVVSSLLSSCETPTAIYPSQAWNTTDNGAVVFMRGKSNIENQFVWDGPVNAEKKAHGFGKMTYANPDVAGDPIFGGGYYPNTTTYEGKMVAGKFEGEVIRKDSVNGKVQRDQFTDGVWMTGDVLRAGYSSSSSSSSGLSDGQLVGGMLGLAGIAGGDSGLAGAGLTMASGNESAGLSQMTEWATSTPGGSSGGSAAVAGASTSAGGSDKKNLIDEWKLRREVKTGGDHMKFYIQAADQAFATFQKSGENAHYDQHREYAQLAQDFHDRTGNKTQGYAR